jgi:radical SAM superfamily enzyme YgiQ (UPF0313 family)
MPMKSNPADIVFVFPPAHGNIGAFKNHLGVAYLRTALAKEGIATTQYVNERPGTIDAVAADILEHRPRIVGFTVYDANFLLALSLASAVKDRRPDVRVVFGGPTATFGAAQILEHHDVVDLCVMGEAEETGARIFSALLDGHSLEDDQPGVAFRQHGKLVSSGLPPLVGADCPTAQSALDTTPSPYLSGILTDGHVGVLTGRGCTHHCQYCVFASLGRKKLRVHSIERVIAELEFISQQQKRTNERYIVAIHDDTFTLLPKRAKELCQAIADRNLGLILSCITRADALDDELLQLMREAGFISLAFGLESAVPSVLRATGKVRPPDWSDPDLEPERHFVEQVRASVIGAKKHGFSVGISIILGLPTESAEDGAATLRFVKEMPVDFYMHNFLWVFPGTPLWETHERYGIKCLLNPMGLPMTYEYAYDITKLRPRPKCSLEQDAYTIRLLTTGAIYACETDSAEPGSIGTVVLHAPELSTATAQWIARILGVGGIVIQIYPKLKRDEEEQRLYVDRCTFGDNMIPGRHHVQVIPKKSGNQTDEFWRIACSGVDLYARHKPHLISFMSSNGSTPLLDWLKGMPAPGTICDVSDYLPQPDELNHFLDEFGEQDIGSFLGSKPIPPDLKYPGRWLPGKAPCLKLSRIEVDSQGLVRCCRHGEPLGKMGDTKESLAQRLGELVRQAEERRGCTACPNLHCPRCPFPGVDDQTYCHIMTNQVPVLRMLNWIHLYARLPLLLNNQRDRMGSD